jgi:hypothetical protein
MKSEPSKGEKRRTYIKNVQQVREHIDLYIEKMLWSKNPEHYAYMIGVISAYNKMVEGVRATIDEIPDRPDVWIDTINDQIKREQDADSQKIILPDTPKIIL